MLMYRVFLGAPTRSFLLENNSENATYEWRTVSSSDVVEDNSTSAAGDLVINSGNNNTISLNSSSATSGTSNNSFLIPHETYEAANSRISEFYQNTIFHDDDDDDEQDHCHSDVANNNQTTVFTWPPTAAPAAHTTAAEEVSHDQEIPSFLLQDNENDDNWNQIETLRSSSSLSDLDYTRSRHLNAASRSIAQFPSFHFNPNTLSSLSQLLYITAATNGPQRKPIVNVLVAILDVDPRSGTDTVKIKNGADAGKEVAVLRMIVGDEDGRVAKLTAWRDVAEVWGGAEDGDDNGRHRRLTGEALKRGDVVLIENVNGSKDAQTSTPVLTASPYLGSRLTICYRTLPREDGDQRWRPDLRLGATDAAVRKVAAVVRWFENMAGL